MEFTILRVVLCNQHVQRRHHEEREQSADSHPTDEHETDGVSRFRPGSANQGEREVPGNGGDAGHEHRPQTGHGSLVNRLELFETGDL